MEIKDPSQTVQACVVVAAETMPAAMKSGEGRPRWNGRPAPPPKVI
jgi:hypothetical protein